MGKQGLFVEISIRSEGKVNQQSKRFEFSAKLPFPRPLAVPLASPGTQSQTGVKVVTRL